MKLEALVWLGVRTERFEQTVRFYRDVVGLDPYSEEDESVRFRLENGTEIHVYGPRDEFHEFFGTAPVVGFLGSPVTSRYQRGWCSRAHDLLTVPRVIDRNVPGSAAVPR